jgi:hypothetical protein
LGDFYWANFRPLGDCFHREIFRKLHTEVAEIFGLLFSEVKIKFHKMGWVTFWAFFSQTHLVTLAYNPLSSENAIH